MGSVEMIELISRGHGEKLKVSEKDFKYAFGLKQWQFDKLISHARKRGFFRFYDYIYTVVSDKNVSNTGKAIYTDFVKMEQYLNDPIYKTIYFYDGCQLALKDIALLTDTVDSTLRRKMKGMKSLKINGIKIECKKYKLNITLKDKRDNSKELFHSIKDLCERLNMTEACLMTMIKRKQTIKKHYIATKKMEEIK